MSCVLFACFVALSVQSAPGDPKDRSLLIVTTTRIRQQSAVLSEFVRQKEIRGFRVQVATEEDYGGQGLKGIEKALLIRYYLQSVHPDFSFLLLLGDSHPVHGDIPMVSVWPRHELSPDNCHGFQVDCRFCETDYLYADLTGNWDLNGNDRYGETTLDEGEGGIDFEPELLVGRIPVYFNDTQEMDRILSNTIAYMNQTKEEISYRNRVLLPAAFFYFKGQKLVGYTSTENVDGADTAEWFARNVAGTHPGITVTRMYENEGVIASSHASDLPLTEENLVAEWAKGYGMVFWGGHGLEKRVARTIWLQDSNENDSAEASEMTSRTMIQSSDAAKIGGGSPAFVAASSCEVGSAETPYNLSYSLLLEGAAVGMIGSSSVTPGSVTDWNDPDSELDETAIGVDNLACRFFDYLIQGEHAGKAFFDAKTELGEEGEPEPMAGKMMINYFGDPSLRLIDTVDDIEQTQDPTQTDHTAKGGGCRSFGQTPLRGCPCAPIVAMLLLFVLAHRRRDRKDPGQAHPSSE